MGVVWNHWFWVTATLTVWTFASLAQGESLSIDSADKHLAQDEDPLLLNDPSSREISVSQSSSVSKVSVKFGGITVRQETEDSKRHSGRTNSLPQSTQTKNLSPHTLEEANVDEVEANIRQSFFQRLLSKLQSLASIRVQEGLREELELVESRAEKEKEEERRREKEQEQEVRRWEEELRRGEELEKFNAISDNKLDEGYQLVYRDGDIQEYLDYTEEDYMYYSDDEDTEYYGQGSIQQINSSKQSHIPQVDKVLDETSNEVDNDSVWTPTLGSEFSTDEKNPGSGRSVGARGRSLVFLEEDFKREGAKEKEKDEKKEEIKEEAVNELWSEVVSNVFASGEVEVTGPNVDFTVYSETEEDVKEGRRGKEEEEEEETVEGVSVLIDRSAVELLTFRNKIGIFIGVIMIALTISVILGVVAVSIRRARRGKMMMKEEEMSHADTVSTVMEGGSYYSGGLPDSVYSDYIRKSSLSCDELTELDNDSFLTSLETISVMDRFGWD